MKLNKLFYIGILLGGSFITSCSDFFDTYPKDQLSPSTFWKTESDAQQAATACYNYWTDWRQQGAIIFYEDIMSDIAYNYTRTQNYAYVGNGTPSASHAVRYYDYTTVARCNLFLENIDNVPFSSEAVKKDLIAQVRTIRAWAYFRLCYWYGGVPLITTSMETAEEAQLPRNSESEVQQFVFSELDKAIADINDAPAERGRIAKGTALAIKMRANLYWGNYQDALTTARQIVALGQYELDPDFLGMFNIAGQGSKEIIYAEQHVKDTYSYGNVIRMFNNEDGGWASWVPTMNLVNMFEMSNGMMPEEEGSGYDPIHPYANRDPRLANTVVYPGQDWMGKNGKTRIINTVDATINGEKNYDYYLAADNASKTGLIFAKYAAPISQYSTALNNDNLCPIIFRYAEVLLTIAECDVELNQNLDEALNLIDQLRTRGGMIKVNRSKYDTQNKIRTLVRRERTIELAGEGFRRQDITRWKNENNQLVANDVMKDLYRMIGTIDYSQKDPSMRFVQTLPTEANKADRLIEPRTFSDYQRFLPIPQAEMDKNPKLTQTQGYD
ncbi:RagB/SusD family nutrient uptake outer membrane protein [Phocaeicola oris]|uniref:RagB/SusD family nutrient uptake outer membrane protein n=1 Tax=Phocaeicola oris TaxID=2896850 RepID=UPI00234F1C9A|nr:RagB/SusD family nutrient uptake outer membrane protein [Phocaeicola oris]MCE2617115.1 RagB/SusD family nutrient uptake outer membrane protein [Phocaeicola oris]